MIKLTNFARRALLPIFASVISVSAAHAIVDGTTTFESLSADLIIENEEIGSSGLQLTDIDGWNVGIYAHSVGIKVSANVEAYYDTKGLTIFSSHPADNDLSAFSFAPTGESVRFDLLSLSLAASFWDGADVEESEVTITGFDLDGNAIAGATFSHLVNLTHYASLDLSDIAQFQQIASFSITSTNADYTMSFLSIDNIAIANVNAAAIPEPSTVAAMLGLSALGVVMLRRRARAAAK